MSSFNVLIARSGTLVDYATMKLKTITSTGRKRKTCCACYAGMLNLLPNTVSSVVS
jgi:hypothetical protein